MLKKIVGDKHMTEQNERVQRIIEKIVYQYDGVIPDDRERKIISKVMALHIVKSLNRNKLLKTTVAGVK